MSEAEMEEPNEEEYDLMMELEQLETLKEEMEELGVHSLVEVEAKMKELNERLDLLHHHNGTG
ncbi:MAG: hypothetical protein ACYC66_13875 [Chloroflexota bacterium]